jgi:hypothetical protein
MANQYTVRVVDNGATLINKAMSETPTGPSKVFSQISVTVAEVTFAVPADIGNAKWMSIHNKDAANFVQFGYATGVYNERVAPGTAVLTQLTPAAANIFLAANVATCECEIYINEE